MIEEDGSIIVPKIEVPESELEEETESEQTEEIPVIAEVYSKTDADNIEYVSEGENGDNEIRIEKSLKQEYKGISLIVPIMVGLVVILGIIYIVFKNKKKVFDIPKDPEEDLQ